jgi:hypothetical protein
MNQQLKLLAPPEANPFEMGRGVRLVAYNEASEPILFADDYGVRLFRRESGQWTEIANNMHYTAGDKTLLPKDQEPLGGIIVPIFPGVLEDQPVTVRAVVIGQLGNEQVAAYIDLTLQPR